MRARRSLKAWNEIAAPARSTIMIMVKNSRITDWLMSRMLTLASASTFEMPAMMPTRSEPMMVMMARPVGGPPSCVGSSGMSFLPRWMDWQVL